MYITVQATFVLTKASVWYEMRVLWANINQVKRHFMALAFNLQTDRNLIFEMKYFVLLMVKRLQKYQWSKLEVDRNLSDQPGPGRISLESGCVINFLSTSNFDLWFFLQPLDLRDYAVPHLKDLIHICLETESQGHDITFNVIYICSKYPHFISYRGFC